MLPENRTHKMQPVDAGVGWLVKKKIREEMGKWLEVKKNTEMWHDYVSAKEKRIVKKMARESMGRGEEAQRLSKKSLLKHWLFDDHRWIH